MKELASAYRNIGLQMKSNALRKMERQQQQQKYISTKLNYQGRFPPKKQNELDLIDKIYTKVTNMV
jgi:hypothetical protein